MKCSVAGAIALQAWSCSWRALVVWHFYHVIFDPDVYPLNWACWNGKVSKHWHDEEHPLETAPPEAEPPCTPIGAFESGVATSEQTKANDQRLAPVLVKDF